MQAPGAKVALLVNSVAVSVLPSPSSYYESEFRNMLAVHPSFEIMACNNSVRYLGIKLSSLPKYVKVVSPFNPLRFFLHLWKKLNKKKMILFVR